METEIAFDLDARGYSVHRLRGEDVQALQTLYEACLDYMLLADGHPAGPHAAEEELKEVPPGRSADDKFMFGIVDSRNGLAGVLDVVRGYPEEGVWWIGLLLLLPGVRSQGVGQKVLDGFSEYVRGSGGNAILLGVVEENERAHRFWSKMGFELVRETEPQQMGNKTQTVRIMRREIKDPKIG